MTDLLGRMGLSGYSARSDMGMRSKFELIEKNLAFGRVKYTDREIGCQGELEERHAGRKLELTA